MSILSFIEYLSLEKKYSKHTVGAYNRDLEQFADFCLEQYEETSIEGVNYSMIRSWIVHLVDQGISNRSVNRKVTSLRSYYKFLLKVEVIEANPLAKHKALKVPKKVQVPFSQDELQRVLDGLAHDESFEGIRNKLIIEMLYATGMRRIELIELKVGDVDFSNQTIKVLGKRNKERILPILDRLLQSIKDYLEIRNAEFPDTDSDHFFLTSKGKKLYETLVYRIINDYFSKASTKAKKSPHILRHTFATHLLNGGADMNAVKELLGHASLASTQVYTHNSLAELKKAHAKAHPRNK